MAELHQPRHAHAAPRSDAAPVLQTLAALAAAALAAQGVLRPFAEFTRAETMRGSLMAALLIAAAATAIWGPFRIRGWRAALAGAAALTAALAVNLIAPGEILIAVEVLAAGLAVGGAMAAALASARREQALITAALTAGLLYGPPLAYGPVGTLATGVPFAVAGLALATAALAMARVRRPVLVTVEAAPLGAVLAATVLASGLLRVSDWLLLGVPVIALAGALAWWAAVPAAGGPDRRGT